jgi:hypothetical protein
MRINLFKWQPQQVHGRRTSSSKATSDTSQTSQDDAVVGSAPPPAGSGRGLKSPAASPPPAITPTSPRPNSTDKRTSAPAPSSVTINASQEQVGVDR